MEVNALPTDYWTELFKIEGTFETDIVHLDIRHCLLFIRECYENRLIQNGYSMGDLARQDLLEGLDKFRRFEVHVKLIREAWGYVAKTSDKVSDKIPFKKATFDLGSSGRSRLHFRVPRRLSRIIGALAMVLGIEPAPFAQILLMMALVDHESTPWQHYKQMEDTLSRFIRWIEERTQELLDIRYRVEQEKCPLGVTKPRRSWREIAGE